MVFVTGLLPASCHKSQPQQKTAPAAIVAGTNNVAGAKSFNGNLGEITLTNHDETCLQLANGSSCTFNTKMLDHHNVRITLTLESKNNYGETRDFSVTQVVAKSGKPLEVAVGNLNLSFTPQVVATE